MTPTINNTDQQHAESPTRRAIVNGDEQSRRIYGRED